MTINKGEIVLDNRGLKNPVNSILEIFPFITRKRFRAVVTGEWIADFPAKRAVGFVTKEEAEKQASK